MVPWWPLYSCWLPKMWFWGLIVVVLRSDTVYTGNHCQFISVAWDLEGWARVLETAGRTGAGAVEWWHSCWLDVQQLALVCGLWELRLQACCGRLILTNGKAWRPDQTLKGVKGLNLKEPNSSGAWVGPSEGMNVCKYLNLLVSLLADCSTVNQSTKVVLE